MSPPKPDSPRLDRGALSDAFVEHGPRLLRYLSRQLAPADAEDLLADTFCTAWTRRAQYRPDSGPIVAWLFGIAANLVRQHKRSFLRGTAAVARLPRSSFDNDDWTDSAIDRLDAVAARDALIDGLASLNDDQREVLLLSCWGQLDNPEIAAALDIPLGTVRTRLYRARRRLLELRETFLTAPRGVLNV
ncbi:MAG TPA: RNA polymerase sigma factor [Jatrophihabitantaceae bacterium]|nr:RNA polymerase sigma factor [Jatrophihabitantaceae bacterium]